MFAHLQTTKALPEPCQVSPNSFQTNPQNLPRKSGNWKLKWTDHKELEGNEEDDMGEMEARLHHTLLAMNAASRYSRRTHLHKLIKNVTRHVEWIPYTGNKGNADRIAIAFGKLFLVSFMFCLLELHRSPVKRRNELVEAQKKVLETSGRHLCQKSVVN